MHFILDGFGLNRRGVFMKYIKENVYVIAVWTEQRMQAKVAIIKFAPDNTGMSHTAHTSSRFFY